MAEGEVCIMNIGPRERRKRLRFGVLSLVMGLGVFVALLFIGASMWWRLALFLPFASAGAGYFQARDKT